MEKRYEKDPINGKWYEVKEEGFTDSEWQEFQERFGQTSNLYVEGSLKLSRLEIVMLIVAMLIVEAKLLGVW